MRPCSTESVKRSSPAKPEAMAKTSQGIRIWPTTVKIRRTKPRPERASRAKLSASSPASTFLAKSGTKARLKAPSAKKRRNMFGSVKAIRNACATGPVPRKVAIRMSRSRPRTRDSIVQAPTLRKAGRRRIGRFTGGLRRLGR